MYRLVFFLLLHLLLLAYQMKGMDALKKEGRAASSGGKLGPREEAKCFDSVSQNKVASHGEIYLC